MANLIEIPFDDGTTKTNMIINPAGVLDIEREFDAVTGTKLNIVLAQPATGTGSYFKVLTLLFGNATSATDIADVDQQALKTAIVNNSSNPGKIGFWKPALYNNSPLTYSLTKCESFGIHTPDI